MQSNQAQVRTRLLALLEKDASGNFIEPDETVRVAAEQSIGSIQNRLLISDYLARLFTGLSLGSILLLVALGLAITYGLLGVINMAHGEMLMIGAYATFVTQQLFKSLRARAVRLVSWSRRSRWRSPPPRSSAWRWSAA